MYICVCITKQQQITSCMVEIQYLTAKVQKLLQWCSCFKTVISRRPLGRITWPRDQFVAKGLYYIWSHQSEAGFPQVVAGRFAPRFEVSYCNAFWSHCTSLEEALQGSLVPCPSKTPFMETLSPLGLKSLRLPLPESSVTARQGCEAYAISILVHGLHAWSTCCNCAFFNSPVWLLALLGAHSSLPCSYSSLVWCLGFAFMTCCRDLYVSVLMYIPPLLPFTWLPYCYPFAPNSFLVAKTGLGLYWTMLSVSGLFGLYC